MTKKHKHKELNSYDSIEQLKKNVAADPEVKKELEKIRNSVKRMQAKAKNS